MPRHPPFSGEPIPDVAYTAEEVETWGTVLRKMQHLLPKHACRQYLRALPLFNFTPERVSRGRGRGGRAAGPAAGAPPP